MRRILAWTVRPVAFVAGLVAAAWRRRKGGHAGEATHKSLRVARRAEKQRRKELWRTTKTPGRRRAA